MLLSLMLYAQDTTVTKDTRHLNSFYVTFVFSGKMIIIVDEGPDIFFARRTLDFEIGYSYSRIFNHKKSQLEFGFYIGRYNYSQQMKLNVDKVIDLQYGDYSKVFLYNRKTVYFDYNYNFTFDYWHRFFNKYGNCTSVMLGLNFLSPTTYKYEFGYYYVGEKQPNGEIVDIPILDVPCQRAYMGQPFYLGIDFGIGHTYRLWRRSKVKFSLLFRYFPKVTFHGSYETTTEADFEAKGRFYKQPSDLAFRISYIF